jgi:hypothetical protein
MLKNARKQRRYPYSCAVCGSVSIQRDTKKGRCQNRQCTDFDKAKPLSRLRGLHGTERLPRSPVYDAVLLYEEIITSEVRKLLDAPKTRN